MINIDLYHFNGKTTTLCCLVQKHEAKFLKSNNLQRLYGGTWLPTESAKYSSQRRACICGLGNWSFCITSLVIPITLPRPLFFLELINVSQFTSYAKA